MRTLRKELADRAVDPAKRRWIYVPYDQLTSAIGPLAGDPSKLGVIFVESPKKAAQRPYHKQKLALVLSNQRHFAIEQAERGVAVRYVVAKDGYASALMPLSKELGPLRMMQAAERELRIELAQLVASKAIIVEPHAGWLTEEQDFLESVGPESPWRMDAFYRHVRRKTNILMDRGKPFGGKFSFDAENRKPWKGEPPAPTPPRFDPDAITEEVAELVSAHFGHHPGELNLAHLPASLRDAETYWRWAFEECVPTFGPFEDAMSTKSTGLFHTRLAALLNIHRLLPVRVVHDVATNDRIPLASREGYVRQILGWREFVHHVHHQTDGFRKLPAGEPALATAPEDGGFGRWRGKAWPVPTTPGGGGAKPSFLDAHEPLPVAYWGEPSGLSCLNHVVGDVWREGWSHHISRLMVLANLATLLGFEPREVTDWFWVAYIDAYDWVVEPNVLAMGTFGVTDMMTTKPYVSGAAYIDRMSDYCGTCAFHPKKNCPITRLYWSFFARGEALLSRNARLINPLSSLRKRSEADKREDARIFENVRGALARGEVMTPASVYPD